MVMPTQRCHIRCIRVLGFFATEMDFGREICLIVQGRDRKARSKKASFTFGHDLQPKHANKISRPKVVV